MPSSEGEPRVPRGGRYAPVISNPVIDAVADLMEGSKRDDLKEVVRHAVSLTRGRYEVGLLFADLICALNGTAYLPLVAGMIQSGLVPGESGPSNPGKYDAICRALQADTEADAIALIIVNGIMGSGFSVGVNTDAMKAAAMTAKLPGMLRALATSIEQQKQGKN